MEYIKLPRNIIEQDWYWNGNACRLFFHLLLIADANGTIKVSLRNLADEMNITFQKLRTALKRLVRENAIIVLSTQSVTQKVTQSVTQKVTRYGQYISICNFDSYKVKGNKDNTINNTISNTISNTNINTIEKETENKEKENFPPHPLYKEKENKEKEKESAQEQSSCVSSIKIDDPPMGSNACACACEERFDWKAFIECWNTTMQNKSIPPIYKMTEKRKEAVKARAREFGKEAILTAIKNAAQSEFMNGHNRKNWTADFDWMFRPNNFPKVLEGNYNRQVQPQQINDYGTSTTSGGYISRYEQQKRERAEREADAYRIMQEIAAKDGGEPLPPLGQQGYVYP